MPYTRREFTKLALGIIPSATLLSPTTRGALETTPNRGSAKSTVNGVRIGLNVPYSFGSNALSADDILARCVELGIGAVELRTQPVEAALGCPVPLVRPRGEKTPAEDAKILRAWRLALPTAKISEFRQRYEDAGVSIEIVKVDGLLTMDEETLHHVFTFAKALGGRALSTEISGQEENLKRVGRVADAHALMVGYHGHASTTPADWEKAFSLAQHHGANVDLGHFVAGNNTSPVDFIEKHHARITHVHVKDRKRNGGQNFPFGEGDTPIVEVLRLIRDRRWPMQATIEFEYPIPTGSTRMAEIARAIKYCQDALA